LTSLTKQQVATVKEKITSGGVTTSELVEELLDHLCTSIEIRIDDGLSFDEALEKVFNELAVDELKLTEMETQEALEGKEIYYPNLSQSIGLIGLMWISGMFISFISNAILARAGLTAIVPVYALCLSFSIMGAAILLAAKWIRQTQLEGPIFSFRSMPTSNYLILFGVAVLIPFWTEPLNGLNVMSDAGFKNLLTSLLKFGIPPIVVSVVSIILLRLLFQGIILNGLLKTLTPAKAIFWSSILAVAVSFTNPLLTFVLNLMLGWVYWKTRSLNATLFASLAWVMAMYSPIYFFAKPGEISWSWQALFGNTGLYVTVIILSLFFTLSLFYFLNKNAVSFVKK
jgi:hypothetical protein